MRYRSTNAPQVFGPGAAPPPKARRLVRPAKPSPAKKGGRKVFTAAPAAAEAPAPPQKGIARGGAFIF